MSSAVLYTLAIRTEIMDGCTLLGPSYMASEIEKQEIKEFEGVLRRKRGKEGSD